jgi:hypothetical protein
MCNKNIICGVLFASGTITFYEGNNMLSALAKYVINRLIHHTWPFSYCPCHQPSTDIVPRAKALGVDIKVSC